MSAPAQPNSTSPEQGAEGPSAIHNPLALRLNEITQYFWINQAVGTFAKLGIADAFNGRPAFVDELARATGCDGSALVRLLRALTGCGIVVELSPDRFDLGALGQRSPGVFTGPGHPTDRPLDVAGLRADASDRA